MDLFSTAFFLLLGMLGVSSPPDQPAPIQVLKIAAGPDGSEKNGTFVFTEERAVFSRLTDSQIVVFFLWEGTPGPHKLVTEWKSPDGGLSSRSAVDYVAKDRRFGAYWPMAFTHSTPTGMWSIEATVDGQPAGRFTFDVRDEKVVAAIVKRPLTEGELYERLNRIFVVLERTTAGGRSLDRGAALRLQKGRLVTAMTALDETDVVWAVSPGEARRRLQSVLAWNRSQDWVVLADPQPGVDPEPIPVAEAPSLQIGVRCFSLEAHAAGSHLLIEGTVSGYSETGAVRRSIARFHTGTYMLGAPVLNEFGELMGLLGGGLPSGMVGSLTRAHFSGPTLVPINLGGDAPGGPAQTIADLQKKGDLLVPVTRAEHIVAGGFVHEIVHESSITPGDQRHQFSGADETFVVFVTWSPSIRLRGLVTLRLYNADNRLVILSEPKKQDYRKAQLYLSSWKLQVPRVPGLYRAEVLFDDMPVWRGFVMITE